jgi:hypothetical protein
MRLIFSFQAQYTSGGGFFHKKRVKSSAKIHAILTGSYAQFYEETPTVFLE